MHITKLRRKRMLKHDIRPDHSVPPGVDPPIGHERQLCSVVIAEPMGEVETVAVSGDFDAATSGNLRRLWTDTTAASVLVDMSSVTFIDAAGVGVLIEVRECLARESRRLLLMALPARVRRLFELVGVCDHLGVEPRPEHRSRWSEAGSSVDGGPEAHVEQSVGRRATLHLGGSWDARSRAAMGEAVSELIERGIVEVRMDMSYMIRIDTDGAAAIQSGLRRLAAARIEFQSGLVAR
jgi:anti-sigma B factor antagonist